MEIRMTKLSSAIGKAFGAGVTLSVAALPTMAQQADQAPQRIEKIEVTGSNIKRVDTEGPSPVQIIDRAKIERTGSLTVSEVLRNITGNSGGSFEDKTFGTFAPGSAGISLRGFGQSETLVLVNGRRVAGYGFAQNAQDGFVDLNSIPLGAVERIEVLKDGASAVYGSDAVAGVINVILRKDYKGAEITLYGGFAKSDNATGDKGADAQQGSFNLITGIGDRAKDKYNLLVNFNYFKRNPLFLRDRKQTSSADARPLGGVDARSPSSPTGTAFNYTTGLYQALPGCPASDLEVTPGGTICKFNFNSVADIQPLAERTGALAVLNVDLLDNITWFTEVSRQHNRSIQQFAPVPSGTYFAANAPGNPLGADPAFVLRRLVEFGPRIEVTNSDTARLVSGFKGSFRNWDWESAGSYGKNVVKDTGLNRGRADLLAAAIANGTFLVGQINPDSVVLPLRIPAFTRTGTSTYKGIDAKVSTELFQLPNGPLGFAAGGDYREDTLKDVPAPEVVARLVTRENSTGLSEGARKSRSLFAEFNIPVLKSLEVNAAGRYDHYSDFGDTVNPKLGVGWKALPNLLVRSTAGTAFRAPGLQELFRSAGLSQVVLVDMPRCAAGVSAACAGTQTNVNLQGNPTLQPEKSKNFGVGVLWDTTKDLSLGLDYFLIDQTNKIQSNPQFILNSFDPFVNPNPPLAPNGLPFVTRSATIVNPVTGAITPGRVALIQAPFINVASQKITGFDFDVKYRFAFADYGKFTVDSNSTYIFGFKQSNAPGVPGLQVAGTATIGGGFTYPKLRNVTTLLWERDVWDASLTSNFRSSVTYGTGAFGTGPTTANVLIGVASFTTWDTQLNYSGLKNTKLTFGIRNLFDKFPPFSAGQSTNYEVEQDDATGRFYYVKFNYKFN